VETGVQVCNSDPCQLDEFVVMNIVDVGRCEDGRVAVVVVAVTGKVRQLRHWRMKGELQLSHGEWR